MAVPSYLKDEDEDEDQLPFLSDPDNPDTFNVGDGQQQLPAPPPMQSAPQQLSPDAQRILGSGNPVATPGQNPLTAEAAADRAKLAQIQGNVPLPPQPKWWQRALAGAVGGMAGYVNASGKRMAPINAEPAVQGIMGAGEYQRQQIQHQAELAGAQGKAAASQGAEADWWKNKQLNNQEQLQEAQSQRDYAQAQMYAGKDPASVERAKQLANEKTELQLIKPWGEDVTLQRDTDPVPPGLEITRSITQPGMVYVHPPAYVKITPDLAPYATGRKVGDVVPYSEFKRAQAAAAKDTVQQNRPVKPPADNVERILLNPGDYPKEQVAQARAMFNQLHRDPNAIPAGAISPPIPQGAPGQRNDAALNGIDPGAAAVIKQLVDYKYQLPSGIALSKPYWQNILQRAAQYDPSFDATQYNTRLGIRKDFTAGKSAQSINSLNTVIGHLDSLQQAGDKLNNFSGLGTVLNAPINAVESATGDPRKNNFELTKTAVADELTRAWRQSGGTEADIKAWGDRLSSSQSPTQLHEAVAEAKQLLASKLASMKNQYETGMGRPADFHILTPESAASLQRSGVLPSDLQPGQAGSLTPQQQGPQNPNPNGYVKGHIYGGMTYLGGDPNNSASWKK